MFTPDDYANMKWRIDEIPKEMSVLERFPELHNTFKEYLNDFATDTLSTDTVVRYIALCYHQHSPFVKKINVVSKRKREVWLNIGVDPDSTSAIEISNHENERISLAVLQFLYFERSTDYLTLTYRKEAYDRMNREMAMGSKKFSKADYDNLRNIEADIERISMRMTSGDSELMNTFGVSQVYENRKLSAEENAN